VKREARTRREAGGDRRAGAAVEAPEAAVQVVPRPRDLFDVRAYALASPVETEGAVAKNTNVLPTVNVPYKKALFDKGVKVEIK